MAGVVDPYIIVDQCLEWIGFGIPNQRASISTEAGFNSLNDLNDIEEKDIRDMADSLQKRTITNRINFGMRCTKWLIVGPRLLLLFQTTHHRRLRHSQQFQTDAIDRSAARLPP